MPLIEPIPLPIENADTLALEWEPLLAFVAGYAASAVGRKAILELRPSTDEAWMTRQHQLRAKFGCCCRSRCRFPWEDCSILRSWRQRRRFQGRRLKLPNCSRSATGP